MATVGRFGKNQPHSDRQSEPLKCRFLGIQEKILAIRRGSGMWNVEMNGHCLLPAAV